MSTATLVISALVAAAIAAGLVILLRGARRRPAARDGSGADGAAFCCPSPDCRHRNLSHARFCARCGRPLKNRNAAS